LERQVFPAELALQAAEHLFPHLMGPNRTVGLHRVRIAGEQLLLDELARLGAPLSEHPDVLVGLLGFNRPDVFSLDSLQQQETPPSAKAEVRKPRRKKETPVPA
jgi:hypothetical protein